MISLHICQHPCLHNQAFVPHLILLTVYTAFPIVYVAVILKVPTNPPEKGNGLLSHHFSCSTSVVHYELDIKLS